MDHIHVFTLNETASTLHLHKMTGEPFAVMQSTLQGFPTADCKYWSGARAWQVSEARLEALRKNHNLTEIPPVVFYPTHGVSRAPDDYREGMVRFRMTLFGYWETRGIPGPWRRSKPIGDLHFPVDVSDLWEHPQRSWRPEISQEHERRMQVVSDTLKARACEEFFQLRHAPQTEEHAFYTYQLAMDRAMGYHHQNGIEVHPVTFGLTFPKAPPIAQLIPVDRGQDRKLVLVVFQDGGVAPVDFKPTSTSPLDRFTYTLKGEKTPLDRVLLTMEQAKQIHRLQAPVTLEEKPGGKKRETGTRKAKSQ